MAQKPIGVEVVYDGDERFIVEIYADGKRTRRKVDSTAKPKRRPRKPQLKISAEERMNRTRQKRY